MPKNHARKKALASLKDELGIKHTCAIALLDHPADERETLEQYLAEYIDINTYSEALAYLRQEQANPRNQLMCDTCGWTFGMVCPECAKGCGCEGECTGWRHEEMRAATGEGDAYGECCYEEAA